MSRKTKHIIISSVVTIAAFSLILSLPHIVPPETPAHYKGLVSHEHVFLKVFWNDIQLAIPKGIGISDHPYLYNYHGLDQFGPDGMAPIHTHDDTGLVHVETKAVRTYTLGEFFDVAGVKTTPDMQVSITSDAVNKAQPTNWRDYPMTNMEHIEVRITGGDKNVPLFPIAPTSTATSGGGQNLQLNLDENLGFKVK